SVSRAEAMPTVNVTLNIDADAYQRHYRGAVREVIAIADDGQRLRFPANILRDVVTRDGVHGRFVIRFDDTGKFLGIRRA
ncbi:MAG: DUF2835 domain-containing protein, partial [Pseudomonadota bacterium]